MSTRFRPKLHLLSTRGKRGRRAGTATDGCADRRTLPAAGNGADRGAEPAPMPIFLASLPFVVLASCTIVVVSRSIVLPSASCSLRRASVMEATPLTFPPGRESTMMPSTRAPCLAMTQSSLTMDFASTAVNASPLLLVFVEMVDAVNTVRGAPERRVNVVAAAGAAGRGAGAGAAGAGSRVADAGPMVRLSGGRFTGGAASGGGAATSAAGGPATAQLQHPDSSRREDRDTHRGSFRHAAVLSHTGCERRQPQLPCHERHP